jgi:mono/diheme cytochrome c family protein
MRSPAAWFLPALGLPALAAARAQDVDFVRDIAPILQERCVECHGEKEQKGDLRLDRRGHLFPDDAAAWVVQPGKPGDSELVRRIELPDGDEDVMPNKGERLRPEQIARLRAWIEAGAAWPAAGDEYFVAAAAARVVPKIDFGIAAPEPEAQRRIDAALQALAARGIVAQRVAADTPAVDVNASLLRDKVGDADLPLLQDLAPVLVWLHLGRTAVTDDGLRQLGTLGQLRRLNLSRTGVGDAGLAHLRGLARLEVLNVYGSKVTDAGLPALLSLPALRKVYAFETAVTADGAAKLAAREPPIEVDRGEYVAARLEQAAAEIAARAAARKPVNAECPVTGKPVDGSSTLEHDGLLLAFCCGDCRAKFQKDPAPFAEKVAEFRRQAAAKVAEPPKSGDGQKQ